LTTNVETLSAHLERLRLAVITTSRADFGIYQPVLEQLSESRKLLFGLIVSGTHLAPEFGLTVEEIRASLFPIWAEAPCLQPTDEAEGVARSCGLAVKAIARALAECKPDMVMVLGDRYEMMGAALAAHIMTIPIAHVHGGEETVGSYDNGFRHAISKLSQLHFPATRLAERRLVQMGEAPERVVCCGAPALDSFAHEPAASREELLDHTGLKDAPFLLVAYHPETLALDKLDAAVDDLWLALQETGLQLLVTAANADTLGRKLNRILEESCVATDKAVFVRSLGHRLWAAAMRHAETMVGNSSSGIIEAAHFGLPVVNVGGRQQGRERSGNVIDCAADLAGIRAALQRARSRAFRESLVGLKNVYGAGQAAPCIRRALEAIGSPRDLLQKPFHMIEAC
jgi:UDP-hydrolysing UDP-N-acetyl-D-glucosamine 2-epimerase